MFCSEGVYHGRDYNKHSQSSKPGKGRHDGPRCLKTSYGTVSGGNGSHP